MKAAIAIATAVTVLAGLYFALPKQSPVAADPFPGIYSIIDPVTGETKDLLKVVPLVNEYLILARRLVRYRLYQQYRELRHYHPVPPATACGPRRARGAEPARVHARHR
ncbi:hypothetical protein [Janthinobacterium sp. LB3P112]|uniref:hypothetical protein n=1 Tax=Janthinobacterium sp. LB3P112 TaxID=3424196 RepID=UPI003F2295E3